MPAGTESRWELSGFHFSLESFMNTDSAVSASNNLEDFFGPPISSYSRKQALEDGELIDVTETAAEAGFTVPVALTRAAWEDCVAWSDSDTARQTYQDIEGRLWDVLWMARIEIRCIPLARAGRSLFIWLRRVPRGGRARRPRLATLKLLAGAGDDGEPVMTILMPDET